jgi:diacylglycerol kinase (ATP)
VTPRFVRHIAFIINPKSGTDRTKALSKIIQDTFSDASFEVEILHTEYAGHAEQLARTCAQKHYESVVAVGGDGTVNEVARALIDTNTTLGIIPKGSGNGLARACGIPLEANAAVRVIAKGYSKTIDTAKINGAVFLSNAGVGFDAHVTQQCMQQNNRGILMYIKSSVRSFATYKAQRYKITVDNEVYREKAIMVSVANGNEFGYGFKIAPTASHVDGKLDVMIIKPLSLFSATRVSFHAWYGNLHKYSKVIHLLGTNIRIESDDMTCHQIDGDYQPNTGAVDICISAKSLQVLVP